jgi:hypothetical protein
MTTTALLDLDSCAYACAYAETLEQMEFTAKGYMNDILEQCRCDDYIGWIESPYGKHNFRNWVAVTPGPKGMGYKAGRSKRPRPPWLLQAKEFIKANWKVEWATWCESEDMCGIYAYELGIENVCIVHIDKDLDTIPGRRYSYTTKEHRNISQEYADWWLGMQAIMGDGSVDNVPGCGKGIGEATAKACLANRASNSIDDIFTIVAQVYQCNPALLDKLEQKHANKLRKIGPLPYQQYIEQSRLVRILRSRNDIFTPCTFERWTELEAAQ